MKFTLDTNCLIDVDEERENAVHIRRLLQAAQEGFVEVALVASSASERQPDGAFLASIQVFEARRAALGFGGLALLPSIAKWNVSFYGHGLWSGPELVDREHAIYRALFPTSPPEWVDYAASKGHNPEDLASIGYKRWRNQMLDAQAYWAHEHAGHDVFVTSDDRFGVLEGREEFPGAVVRNPSDAIAYL